MGMIEFEVNSDEVRELGLLMLKRHGSNVVKQYVILRAVAEVLRLLHLEGCEVSERLLVEESSYECDAAALGIARDVVSMIRKATDN